MLIDTHAHLNIPDFFENAEEEIERTLNENVWVINCGVDRLTSERAVSIADGFERGVYAAVGVQPEALLYDEPEVFDRVFFKRLAENEKVVAIGEAGLDLNYLRDFSPEGKREAFNRQKALFKDNLSLAVELDKPIVIHCRDAFEELAQLLRRNYRENKIKGVMHCFSGTVEDMQAFLDMGFYISFSGIVTFSKKLDEAIKEVQMDKILIETDSPFLAPNPQRGKKNHPLYVHYVAEKIAEVKNLSFERVAEQTFNNARELFGI